MIGLPGLTDGELAKRGRFYAKSNRLLSEAFLLLVMLFTVQDAFLLTTLISLANKRDQVPEFASKKKLQPAALPRLLSVALSTLMFMGSLYKGPVRGWVCLVVGRTR